MDFGQEASGSIVQAGVVVRVISNPHLVQICKYEGRPLFFPNQLTTFQKGKGMIIEDKKKLLDYIYQLLLVLLGASIALASTRVTHYWQTIDERKEVTNLVGSCIQDEINNLDGYIKMLKTYAQNPSNEKLSTYSFRWQHESGLIKAVGLKAGI
jgi:hypothetical protein